MNTGKVGDNPIMGISMRPHGRIVVDLLCNSTENQYESDEIYDIDINSVEGGSPLNASCNDTTNCRTFTNNPNVPRLRPTDNLGVLSRHRAEFVPAG